MEQFWIIHTYDGRRALIEDGAGYPRFDRFIGFGLLRRWLPSLAYPEDN